jgi:hypothetical protein
MMTISKGVLALLGALILSTGVGRAAAPAVNLVANPGFEQVGPDGFASEWAQGEFGKLGKTVFLEDAGARVGQRCLRLAGTPSTWTTCAGKRIPVRADAEYWVTWWCRAQQPGSSRTYLFLQTNTGQRVFPQTDRRGDVEWTLNLARYRTRPDELWLSPVLTMQTMQDQVGTSWWDEISISENLTPELEAAYRREHPWDDAPAEITARRLAVVEGALIWSERAETRLYPDTALPTAAPAAAAISLAAPGNGHDLCQLVVSPATDLAPLRLEFAAPTGPGPLSAATLSAYVAHCVNVTEPLDPAFPKGRTPDPLLAHNAPEPAAVATGNVIFWIDWAAPVGLPPGEYRSAVTVRSGDRVLARLPLVLRRWGFDLPEVPHYRSMVLVGGPPIRRFYPGLNDTDALALAWDILAAHRLSGFNLAAAPAVQMKDGVLSFDWTRFDQILVAARRYRATALTLGPMFGGGCSEGWKPRFKLAGFTALADEGFAGAYSELNRQMAERLRQAGLLDLAYVYPYDEPETDYMDKVGALCDLIHQGASDLKVLATTDPATGQAIWGKVNAWIVPWSSARPEVVGPRRLAGDEVWVYNMTASIESTPLSHRTFMWHALSASAAGGLLWNACWWNGINPWEKPTAAPVPVGRNNEQLYHYSAGQASLFYPDPAGKGPLVPSLRLLLIRQGVEDFDLLTSLLESWARLAVRLPDQAAAEAILKVGRKALTAPVVLDLLSATSSPVRVEALRHLVASDLEAAAQGPAVIAFFARQDAELIVTGGAEAGTVLAVDGQPLSVRADGTFRQVITAAHLAGGLHWTASKAGEQKSWAWPGIR